MKGEFPIQKILVLLKESDLSPEDLGERMGISGMTIRRWFKRPETELLPELYAEGARRAVYSLILENKLGPESESARWAFETSDMISHKAILHICGFPMHQKDISSWDPGEIVAALERLGNNPEMHRYVDANLGKLDEFKVADDDWSTYLSKTIEVMRGVNFTAGLRALAVGTLYYLLMPYDLIPDAIPVVGLIDDFAILTVVGKHFAKSGV